MLVFHDMKTPGAVERSELDESRPLIVREWRIAMAWVIGAVILRAILSSLVPLLPDETYYWDWSRRLAAGYFDHPPGIAWMIAAGSSLAGSTVTGVRLGPAAAALVTHLGVMACAGLLAGGSLAGARAGRRAAQLVAVIPLAALGMVLATPDALLFAATAMALVFTERALASPLGSHGSLVWWLAAGMALGVAFLAKYTAVLLPLGLVIAFLTHSSLRKRFTEPGPWLAGMLAIAIFAPVAYWNSQHDWVSFRFQLDHGFGRAARGTPLSRELEMIGGQAALASPILFCLLVSAVRVALRDGWRARVSTDITSPLLRRYALAVVALIPIIFFAVSAWRRPVEANWPAIAYPAAIVLLASGSYDWARGKWWRKGLWLSVLLLVVVALQAWRPILPLKPSKDPIARAHGWDQLGQAVDSVRRTMFSEEESHVLIAAERYQDASELAFHMKGNPSVLSLNLGGRRNQYDLWPDLSDRSQDGTNMIAVFDANAKGDSLAQLVGGRFDVVKSGPDVSLERDGNEVQRRRIWIMHSLSGKTDSLSAKR